MPFICECLHFPALVKHGSVSARGAAAMRAIRGALIHLVRAMGQDGSESLWFLVASKTEADGGVLGLVWWKLKKLNHVPEEVTSVCRSDVFRYLLLLVYNVQPRRPDETP